MNKIYSALDVSRYIISYLSQKNIHVTNLKLQKLLYFIQAYSLKVKEDRMFLEDIEAWKYGPVVPEVYQEYKWAGSSKILIEKNTAKLDDKDKTIIENVLDKLGSIPSRSLVERTHEYKTWKDAIINCWDKTIYINDIKIYHKNREAEKNFYF